ncbi:hypothetical protein [Burkholderia latens]|uniref:Uncharacterized protein n=1 Tax=Burkholderia latens TaxID=488446 RepID=A0A6P2LFF3_9BURK|nr:hypothetical protein BLA24064_03058 [Burkholderia latens]
MTRIDEIDASPFPARFASMAIDATGDAATVTRLLADAAESLPDTGAAAPPRTMHMIRHPILSYEFISPPNVCARRAVVRRIPWKNPLRVHNIT